MNDLHTRLFRYSLLTLIILLAGCGASSRRIHTSEQNGSRERIDPFLYGDEFALPLQSNTPSNNSSTSEITADTISPVIQSNSHPLTIPNLRQNRTVNDNPVFGYRVQIGIDENKERMMALVEQARSSIDQNVYLEFEAPFYRVRVGDFKTRQEAEKYTRLLKENGFRDALWVMSQIAVK